LHYHGAPTTTSNKLIFYMEISKRSHSCALSNNSSGAVTLIFRISAGPSPEELKRRRMEKKKAKMLEFKSKYLKKSMVMAEVAAEIQKYHFIYVLI
jgi:hypothetical protein